MELARSDRRGVTRRAPETDGPDAAPVPLPRAWSRPVVRAVQPQVDEGGRPAKTTVGEQVRIVADAFVDGHDALWCELRHRHETESRWGAAPMHKNVDDRWYAVLPVEKTGLYRFCVRARVDEFATWRDGLAAKVAAGQSVSDELLIGAELITAAAGRARGETRRLLGTLAAILREGQRGLDGHPGEEVALWLLPGAVTLGAAVFSERLGCLMGPLADPETSTSSATYQLLAEAAKARFSAWYEMFPRAEWTKGRRGTLSEVRSRLDYVERMGFDVLYLPPVHPIGTSARKGRNGATSARPGDPGSPWAIGGPAGGHDALHPDLGTLEDFRGLVADAASRGIDVAIDLAFQASPDHPWVHEHPEWFRHLPDGRIRFAENPPKRYEDIYPFDFESPDWPGLWTALRDVVLFWIDQGVTVFRVDNPHTKPFAFWEWLLASIKARAPGVVFLSEAFTRPRVMEHLARIGFTQSYTYFTWRRSKWELESYLTELTQSDVAAYLRPNLWPNTPDILTEELQTGGRGAFLSRLVLAATMSASYGIYGPAFELQEHVPRERGSEEYLGSEKYEVRRWDVDDSRSLAPFIALVNRIRREHEALQYNDTLRFHWTDNDQLMAYSKVRRAAEATDVVLVVVNLDHHYPQSGWVHLDLEALGISADAPYEAHDLLSDAHYTWHGSDNFVKLDPHEVPCHIMSISQSAAASNGDVS
jgi:starch synthase (maltosyl-transferring)